MKIPPDQYQFTGEHALLLTTGKQTGRLFFARNGSIKEIDEAFIPTPKYSDDEGFFATSGRGVTFGSGSIRESKDIETKHKFIRVIRDKVDKAIIENNADAIYLFSPNYEITELKESLSREARNMISSSFMGNFVKFAPDMLLQKLSAKAAKAKSKKEILKPEEAKIMARPRESASRSRRQMKTGSS